MPVYEYQCQQCGVTFERIKPMSAMDDDEVCPSCSSGRTRRLLSAFAAGKSSGSSSGSGGCGPSSRFS